MTRLDNLSKNAVFFDPLRRCQEDLYSHLLSVREAMCSSLSSAVENAGNAAASAEMGPASSVVSSKETAAESEELRAENKKLNYRVTHLLRAIEEKEKAK